jgi:hypothetical protein
MGAISPSRYSERREALAGLFKRPGPLALSEALDTEPANLIRAVKEFGVGIVAKRKESCYDPGKRDVRGSRTEFRKPRASSSAATRADDPLDALIVRRQERQAHVCRKS